ncbi:MAG: hypothetical protein FWE02_06730 [Defluviitaleaceae bacterium]|nr:hypothetical protein [Defluviitaleaceae bacterium]
MTKLDEQILDLRYEEKKHTLSSLEDGFYIKGELVEFQEVEIENQNLTIYIPQDFITLPLEIARVKYPAENRPQWIKSKADTSVNICVSLLQAPLDERNLQNEITNFKALIKRLNPSNEFYENEIVELENFKIAWFDYKSFAIDNQMYNMMFFASVQNQMLHGVFNCLYDDFKEWKTPAIQMIKSIKIKNIEVTNG